jgi:hypothetical protein
MRAVLAFPLGEQAIWAPEEEPISLNNPSHVVTGDRVTHLVDDVEARA